MIMIMIMMMMMTMMTMMKCEYLNMNMTNTMNDTIYSNINDNTEIITIFLQIEVPRPRPVPQASCGSLRLRTLTASHQNMGVSMDTTDKWWCNLTVCYWKWQFIVDFPMKNGNLLHFPISFYVNVYQRVNDGWSLIGDPTNQYIRALKKRHITIHDREIPISQELRPIYPFGAGW